MNTEVKKPQFIFLQPLSMIYITVMLLALMFIYRPLAIGSYVTTCAGLISPLVFVLGDVIAEIYGYQESKKVLIYALICEFIFCFGVKVLNAMPCPSRLHGKVA